MSAIGLILLGVQVFLITAVLEDLLSFTLSKLYTIKIPLPVKFSLAIARQ